MSPSEKFHAGAALPDLQTEPGRLPRARGLPLVGNAFSMAGDLRAFLTEQYGQLGPVFQVQAFRKTFIVMAGPEANLFLQRQSREHLRSQEFWADFDAEMGAAKSISSMDGPEHQRLRQAMRDGYSRAYFEGHLPEALEIVRREVAHWPLQRPLPGFYTMQRIVADQVATLCTGVSSGEYLDDLIAFLDALLLARATKRRPGLMMRAPRVRRARRRLDALCAQIIEAHRQAGPGTAPDLIDDLLELHRSDPQFLPETDLPIATLGPFFAGLDTLASICSFMLYSLLKHPDLLRRMQAEADELFADGTPAAPDIRQLDITHRVALETMRMYPIVPALTRTVTNSFEFAGYRIPAGARVMIAVSVPHYLPEYFPDPERFDIDRYTNERKEHTQPGVFAPFGLGPHSCLGNAFAQTQIALTMAAIVHEADLTLTPLDYRLKIDPAPTPSPDKSFKFKVIRRR